MDVGVLPPLLKLPELLPELQVGRCKSGQPEQKKKRRFFGSVDVMTESGGVTLRATAHHWQLWLAELPA